MTTTTLALAFPLIAAAAAAATADAAAAKPVASSIENVLVITFLVAALGTGFTLIIRAAAKFAKSPLLERKPLSCNECMSVWAPIAAAANLWVASGALKHPTVFLVLGIAVVGAVFPTRLALEVLTRLTLDSGAPDIDEIPERDATP